MLASSDTVCSNQLLLVSWTIQIIFLKRLYPLYIFKEEGIGHSKTEKTLLIFLFCPSHASSILMETEDELA